MGKKIKHTKLHDATGRLKRTRAEMKSIKKAAKKAADALPSASSLNGIKVREHLTQLCCVIMDHTIRRIDGVAVDCRDKDKKKLSSRRFRAVFNGVPVRVAIEVQHDVK